MPRNHLKTFPTAILRRGMVHFRPAAGAAGRNLAVQEHIAPPEADVAPIEAEAPVAGTAVTELRS